MLSCARVWLTSLMIFWSFLTLHFIASWYLHCAAKKDFIFGEFICHFDCCDYTILLLHVHKMLHCFERNALYTLGMSKTYPMFFACYPSTCNQNRCTDNNYSMWTDRISFSPIFIDNITPPFSFIGFRVVMDQRSSLSALSFQW